MEDYNLKRHFLERIVKLGGNYEIRDGVVHATMPNGSSWEFSVPKEVGQYEPEDK